MGLRKNAQVRDEVDSSAGDGIASIGSNDAGLALVVDDESRMLRSLREIPEAEAWRVLLDLVMGLLRRNRELETELRSRDEPENGIPLSLAAYERTALERALREQNGDATAAARRLGVGRSTFYRKLSKYGIRTPERGR